MSKYYFNSKSQTTDARLVDATIADEIYCDVMYPILTRYQTSNAGAEFGLQQKGTSQPSANFTISLSDYSKYVKIDLTPGISVADGQYTLTMETGSSNKEHILFLGNGDFDNTVDIIFPNMVLNNGIVEEARIRLKYGQSLHVFSIDAVWRNVNTGGDVIV